MFGKEVATLVNEEKPAGEYSVMFTVGQDCSPAGIYLVNMRCDGTSRNRKMLITY